MKNKSCGKKRGSHVCTRKKGHKGKHRCGKGVIDIPFRICKYEWPEGL